MDFSTWLKAYLLKLSTDIDADIFGDYIQGLLEDETIEKNEKSESVFDFLASVLPTEKASAGSEEIVTKFTSLRQLDISRSPVPKNKTESTDDSTRNHADSALDNLECQMRSLLQQPKPELVPKQLPVDFSDGDSSSALLAKHRDACTIAVLRAAGVGGYQETLDSERDLAVALADAEYFAKQKLISTGSAVPGPDQRPIEPPDASLSPEAEDIDLEELEDAAGYGKKDGIKPGSVLDALSVLNPHQFGSTHTSSPSTISDLKLGKTKRLPTPGDISSSTPAYLLMSSKTYRTASPSTNVAVPGGVPPSGSDAAPKKKKPALPTKHMADIGARAEEKHQKMEARKNVKLSNVPVAGRNRLDDMDAFFISDDDEDRKTTVKSANNSKSDILNEGGGNRDRVKDAETAARAAAAKEFADKREREKAERLKQLEKEAARKQTAQQRAQKQERRRH